LGGNAMETSGMCLLAVVLNDYGGTGKDNYIFISDYSDLSLMRN
jgi:hypothetical protein